MASWRKQTLFSPFFLFTFLCILLFSPQVSKGSPTAPRPKTLFPLTISPDKKYLVDAQEKPFLIQGDSAWSTIAELSNPSALRYLDDRKKRGFNTLLVNLIEHKFTSHSPRWLNASNVAPFADVNDFTTANEAYFAHADWFIREAGKRGFLILLAPCYIGWQCADDGWCAEMKLNGVEKLRKYGLYLGKRYKDFPNILWVEGGDHTPSKEGHPSE